MAFTGVVGTDDQRDFSALGDAVNVAARLGSVASADQILVSLSAARAAGLDIDAARVQSLALKGRQESLDVMRL